MPPTVGVSDPSAAEVYVPYLSAQVEQQLLRMAQEEDSEVSELRTAVNQEHADEKSLISDAVAAR